MYDLAVIGGGINGCGITRDAAGRGLKVLLVERGDLAGGTSSASTKLIHGGLRYLEHHEFRLVRESLMEREVLLGMAPHIAWPLRFVLPHHKGLRPAWLIRLGLFLYDHLGGRKVLSPCRAIDLHTSPVGQPLKPTYRKAFEYADCWVDDARMVVLNAKDAASRGGDVRVRTELISATPDVDHWALDLKSPNDPGVVAVQAKALVNAAGPWVADVLKDRIGGNRQACIRLVRGSHIVVPRLFDHDRAYIFQNADCRIVFAIPYEDDFTLIGTTDVDVGDDPTAAVISDDEIDYLCTAVSEYLTKPVQRNDIVWTYAGIRPLFDDSGRNDTKAAQTASRDYVLDFHSGTAPLLNVFGGKITTYRRLAEEAVDKFTPVFPAMGSAWTRGALLPGGDMPAGGHEELARQITARCPDLPAGIAQRLARTYGHECFDVIPDDSSLDDLGQDFGAGLFEAEVVYLIEAEWARSAEDIVWRRTKRGLRLSPDQIARLDRFIHERLEAIRHG